MKRAVFALTALVVFALLALSCRQEPLAPEAVLSIYLDSVLHNKYEKAYSYVSSKDKAARTLEDFLNSQRAMPVERFMKEKTTFLVKSVAIKDDMAEVQAEITLPDIARVMADIPKKGEATEEEIKETIGRKLRDENLPMVTKTETFRLLKEEDAWRVFFNWKSEHLMKGSGVSRENPAQPSSKLP